MATTTQRGSFEQQPSDELTFHNDAVSLCMMVNRRHRTTRVIDFRAGATAAKRNFVLQTAMREGIEKVFVLVERDEVATWTRLGLRREGNIPSFYRRSDAWMMGAVVATVGPVLSEDAYDDEEVEEQSAAQTPGLALAEKTVERARKLVKETAGKSVPATKIAPIKRAVADKAVATAAREGVALTGFEPFSRDAERHYVSLTGRGGFELCASYELQPSFGSAMVELLVAPADEARRSLTISALRTLLGRVVEVGCHSAFAFAPADDVLLSSCFVATGFTKSGVLSSHLEIKGVRKDAIIWSNRLVDE